MCQLKTNKKLTKQPCQKNKFKILTFKLLGKDKNVSQKLFSLEKNVFFQKTKYSLERLSKNLFSLRVYHQRNEFKTPSNNICRIIF